MPASYVIDIARHLIVTTLSGWVSRDELLTIGRAQIIDPRSPNTVRHLVDGREIAGCGLDVDDSEAAAFVHAIEAYQGGRPHALRARTAIVLGRSPDTPLLRLLDRLADAAGNTAVFFDLDQACRWLGLDRSDLPNPGDDRA